MNESTFPVHHIEFLAKSSPRTGNGGIIRTIIRISKEIEYSIVTEREVFAWSHPSGTTTCYQRSFTKKHNLVIINPHFKACGTPIHELDCFAGFNDRDSVIGIVGDNISTV